jgi:hypothetical protein
VTTKTPEADKKMVRQGRKDEKGEGKEEQNTGLMGS